MSLKKRSAIAAILTIGLSTGVASADGVSPTASPSHLSGLAIHVLSAWQDPAPGHQSGFYIHDRVAITGLDQAASVSARDFTLSVKTADGQSQTLSALTQAAPKYSKAFYAMHEVLWMPQVAVKEDLGAQGSLDIPPHGNVTTVVTFYTPSAVDSSHLSDITYH
jgi:hypothetical protein